MSKKKSIAAAENISAKALPGGATPSGRKVRKAMPEERSVAPSWMSAAATREMVESVVVAFVLAFLFRTFEAEAFVIPTGSMAPTLMGRHRDVNCPKCGFAFQVNASSEVDPRTNQLTGDEVVAGTCPNCRFTFDMASGNPQHKDYPSYKGDRILVAKYPYQFGSPERWDVAVFKYPGGAKTNYIKRICGLPNETLYIRHGDLYYMPDGQDQKVMARKSPEKILAMMQPVYNNDCVLSDLVQKGLPPRWIPVSGRSQSSDGWQASEDLRSFRADGTPNGEAWLHYRHCVPTYRQWQELQRGSVLRDDAVRAQLITDFTGYNTERTRRDSQEWSREPFGMGPSPSSQRLEKLGLNWVGDLVLECTVDAQQPSGQFLMTLVQGGLLFHCELDLASGKATLSIDGLAGFRPTATTGFRGPGKHRVRLANVDGQLTLWVDGSVAKFDASTAFGPLDNSRPRAADLEPARIGSRGAAVQVSHIKLFRDIYYIAQRYSRGGSGWSMTEYDTASGEFPHFYPSEDVEEKLAEFFSNPEEWDVFNRRREVDFALKEGQFLALGDNSAESKDSRLWEQDGPQYYVSRDLLIGKALFVYWPHSWDKVPGTNGWPMFPNGIWFPFFPNFARMGFVR
jgi:signal peptidase I